MTMSRSTTIEPTAPFLKIAAFWNWLPAFRAVAEWGGVGRAAEKLHTSPSSLSRSVKLLEDSVGAPLFRRNGRSLVLTAEGEALLDATRLAMRGVHDATTTSASVSGPLHVATTSRLGTVRLLGALRALRRRHPDVVPSVTTIPHDGITHALLSGEIDVALTLVRVADPHIDVEVLATAENAVFCGPDHPLWSRPDAAASEILAFPFAAPEDEAKNGCSVDGWPAELARIVALRSSMLEPGVDACVRGELLAVLPTELVDVLAPTARLRPLRAVVIPPTPVFVARRRPVAKTAPCVAALVDLLTG